MSKIKIYIKPQDTLDIENVGRILAEGGLPALLVAMPILFIVSYLPGSNVTNTTYAVTLISVYLTYVILRIKDLKRA